MNDETIDDSARVRQMVVEAVEAVAGLVGEATVAERWDTPSALGGMTVGALAAHTLRAAGATIAYLDRTDAAERPDGELLTAVTYFHAAIDSPIHDRIKEVSADESTIGHAATVERFEALATDLRTRLAAEPADRLIAALGGRMIRLDDFCRTRLIEVLTHLDDLAASVDVERPATDPEGIAIVNDVLVGIARHLHGDWTVMRALSRAERVDGPPVFPVF